MSGDLKSPGKSLPLGTFIAVGLSILVYFFVILILAGVLPNRELAEDYQAMHRVAKYGFLIDAGVIAATIPDNPAPKIWIFSAIPVPPQRVTLP